MAYNLQSLITILQGILDPEQRRWILGPQKPQLQSLLEKASSLQQILEKTPLTKIPSLERRIRDVANEAEDIVESHMVKRMLSIWLNLTLLTPDVLLLTQKLDSLIEQVAELVEVETNKKPTAGSSSSGASFSSSKSVVVGVDEDLKQLKDRLIGMQRKLEMVPIVGMGGIGKTTLARTLYQDSHIDSHFDYCAWTTISQDYNMRPILLSLIQCIIGKQECDKHKGKGDSELKDILYQSLYCRRYMVVLDDIWSTTFWDEISRYFPDNNNGSRIVITTRESDVAKYVASESLLHKVQLLSESQSWDLLSQIVFGEEEEDCPHELKGIGNKIASDCGGLPLAINVIGGLLSKVERLKDVWENIGNDVRAAIGESDKQFSNILSLSYNHLPLHLKPCFLYMAAFPEDYQIKTSRLIQMWVAEGFVKSNGDKSLEEEAEDYLKSLVERNLVSVITSYVWFGEERKRYSMHDLLRDLCIRKADDEKFLHLKNSTFCNQLRRVSIHTSYGMEDIDEYASSSEMSLVRSFLLFIKLDRTVSPMVSTLSLLRVLDLLVMYIGGFPKEILQLMNLRYLAINCYSLPRSGISRLCNLQTLIANLDDKYCPAELWKMYELRHLIILGTYLRIEVDYINKSVLKKLQTIHNVHITSSMIRRGFLESIPNIKSLDIWYEGSSGMSEVVDLSHLHKLQTLSWMISLPWKQYLHVAKLPSTLRKLKIFGCVITPAATTALCVLPNLEELTIVRCTFKSNETEEEEANEEWEIAEGDEFSSLQFLLLRDCYRLVRWRADETNFPRLRHLIIQECDELEEIPAGIGEIPTLQLIELKGCSNSVEASAKQIQEEQQSVYENYDLQLRIFPY